MVGRGRGGRGRAVGTSRGRANGGIIRPRAGSSSARGGVAAAGPAFPKSCSHYRRRVFMVAPCCGATVCCEKGHDAGPCPCKLSRNLKDVTELACAYCHYRQPLGKACINPRCKVCFGKNGCTICRKWTDSDSFHCSACGVCHPGKREETSHCSICQRCFPIRSMGGHICSRQSLCAACGHDTRSSQRPTKIMRCRHVMHDTCFKRHVAKSFACPVRHCGQTVAHIDPFNRAIQHCAPADTASKAVRVYCRDCRRFSMSKPQGQWRPCAHGCGYNTVATNAPVPPPPPRR